MAATLLGVPAAHQRCHAVQRKAVRQLTALRFHRGPRWQIRRNVSIASRKHKVWAIHQGKQFTNLG